jgi:hypothetical protein
MMAHDYAGQHDRARLRPQTARRACQLRSLGYSKVFNAPAHRVHCRVDKTSAHRTPAYFGAIAQEKAPSQFARGCLASLLLLPGATTLVGRERRNRWRTTVRAHGTPWRACPLHERSFDLRTGQGLSAECASLQAYPVSLGRDGQIWVTIEQKS